MKEDATIRSMPATPLKAIRAKCLDCCCGSTEEVKLCTIPTCPLYKYRLGKNPAIKRAPLTDEQKQAVRVRFEKSKSTENT